MKTLDKQGFLENARKYLEAENLGEKSEKYAANDPRLVAASIELANESKAILGGLYFDFRKADRGFFRKLKNKVIGKIANIVRNTMERPLLTQQKYNEQIYYLVNMLLEENKQLRSELAELKSPALKSKATKHDKKD
jgi:hypothetical protein